VDPENVLNQAAADKGYDSDAIRETLAADGIDPVIPPKCNRRQPPAYDRQTYRERNRVERFFNKLKHFRRIATRYDKLADSFLALVHLVTAFIFTRNS
jgi:transposase